MRREGVLTGYLWSRNSDSFGKVKVKGKPTNASKASGRCGRAKCSNCHDLPVSKAKSKTKGRNKRAFSRFLVDDEWAFCKCAPARRIKAVSSLPSHVDHDDDYTYDALDACHTDAELSGHDVHDYAYDVRDECHAEAELIRPDINDNANDDHDIKQAHDVSSAHDADYPLIAMFTLQDCPCPDSHQNADDVIIDDDDYAYDVRDVCHAKAKLMSPDVNDNANDGHDIKEAHDVSDAADDVSGDDDDDDDVCDDDDDANDFQSLISGLVNVEWPTHDDNEEVSDAESEENSLSDDWCHVTSSDAIDDWYLC